MVKCFIEYMYQLHMHNSGKLVTSLECEKCPFECECDEYEKYKDNSDVCKDNNSESGC